MYIFIDLWQLKIKIFNSIQSETVNQKDSIQEIDVLKFFNEIVNE